VFIKHGHMLFHAQIGYTSNMQLGSLPLLNTTSFRDTTKKHSIVIVVSYVFVAPNVLKKHPIMKGLICLEYKHMHYLSYFMHLM
jgi:hypothetical protein